MEQINNFIEAIKQKELIDVLIAIGIIILFYIMRNVFSNMIIKIFKVKGSEKQKLKNSETSKGLKTIFICIGVYIALLILNLEASWFSLCSKILRIVIIISVTRIISELISPESKIMKKVGKSERLSENKITIGVVSKIIKAIVYIIAGFMIIADLGYDLSGLITGLGLSSVVIALAAQELVENLLSGMAIVSDKPFELGDYVRIGDYEGTVIDIKFRSTKIRMTDNTIVTIQNAKIVSGAVINISKIEKRKLALSYGIPLDTSSIKVKELMESIKMLLYSNTEVMANSVIVYINEITQNAIKIEIFSYLSIVDYTEFLNFKTKVNLSIIKLLEDKNIKLAMPPTAVHLIEENIDKREVREYNKDNWTIWNSRRVRSGYIQRKFYFYICNPEKPAGFSGLPFHEKGHG